MWPQPQAQLPRILLPQQDLPTRRCPQTAGSPRSLHGVLPRRPHVDRPFLGSRAVLGSDAAKFLWFKVHEPR